jgi:hypothetical protein
LDGFDVCDAHMTKPNVGMRPHHDQVSLAGGGPALDIDGGALYGYGMAANEARLVLVHSDVRAIN